MGYNTQIYAIDLPKLRAFYGSKDEAQLASVFAEKGEELESLNERFGDEIDSNDDEWPLSEDALAEICAGQCICTNAGPLYGYVLEILCRSLGQHAATLGPLKMHPYRSRLLNTRLPIPIPASSDFPAISFLDHSEVASELVMVRSFDRPDDECLAEDMDEYQSALEQAASKQNGIIAFYY